MQPTLSYQTLFVFLDRRTLYSACMHEIWGTAEAVCAIQSVLDTETRGCESWLLQGPRDPRQGLMKLCVWIVWLRPTHLLQYVCVRQVGHEVPRARTWVNWIWGWLCSRLLLCFITWFLCNSNFPSICHCIFAVCERYSIHNLTTAIDTNTAKAMI